MSRILKQRCAVCAMISGLLAAVMGFAVPNVCHGQAQDPQIQAHLAAGEFGSALALARRLPNRADRDAWLARIAASQAQAGARAPALRTIAEISDDQARTNGLSSVNSVPLGGRGGAAMADFQSLIDLIQNTVAPTTWDTVGGPGSIAPFPTGVLVDSTGLLQPLIEKDGSGKLELLRASGARRTRWDNARVSSKLRKVSLTRLEKHIQLRLAAGVQPTEAMQFLAGLTRVKYVFVYPESGDLVLAGPAGDWIEDQDSRVVSTQSGEPVLQLDDLVVVLRRMMDSADAQFGCMINPTQDALARTQVFVNESNKRSLPPGRSARRRWIEQLRSQMGQQNIEIFGLDPRTRAARVMVEADYRMKLVGMGLEEGVPGIESYLDSIDVPRGQAPPPIEAVLRWWFTLNYDALRATADRNAYAVRGQGVKVLSENEKLAADGTRIHTGRSEELNRKFAQSFTQHFEALCEKNRVYAELRNLFDLALVCALIREERLADRVGWHLTCFGDPGAFPVQTGPAPTMVETVVNHRLVNQVHILAGLSGGVLVDPGPVVARDAIEIESQGPLDYQLASAKPDDLTPSAWWWD